MARAKVETRATMEKEGAKVTVVVVAEVAVTEDLCRMSSSVRPRKFVVKASATITT